MIQFLIIATIVGAFTAFFFDVPTSLKVGRQMVTFWIVAGLVLTVISPFIDLGRIIYYLTAKFTGLFKRKSPR